MSPHTWHRLVGGLDQRAHLPSFSRCSLRFILLAQKRRHAPYGHCHMKNNRRPQADSGLRLEAGASENDRSSEVIEHHCAHHSPGGAALRVGSRQPTGNGNRQERCSGHARDRHGRRGIERSPKQYLCYCRGQSQQAKADPGLKQGRDRKQSGDIPGLE